MQRGAQAFKERDYSERKNSVLVAILSLLILSF